MQPTPERALNPFACAISSKRIRPIALCLFRYRGRILVNEAHDAVKNQRFFRPIGGGIEFGETGAFAAAREVREELQAHVTNLRFHGTLENIFTYNGTPGHEIVLIYDGEFSDRDLYTREFIPGVESNGHPFAARWRRPESFTSDTPLYPHGLPELLRSLKDEHGS